MALRLGLSDPAQAVGKTTYQLLPRGSSDDHDQDGAVLRSGEPQNYRIEQRSLADGSVAWDLATRLPLRDRAGSIVGLIGIFRDITSQQRADEKIRESIRRRDQFLAMLSHELRNPLGAVVTAMALLRDGAENRDKLLGIVERQTHHMGRLLDDLLEASRVTQNKIELRVQRVDIVPILRDAVDAVRNTLTQRGLQLNVSLPGEPMFVRGDEARLLQVFVNVLSNAVKYTPAGGHIELSASIEQGQGVVRVRDDGAGIAKEFLDQIFDLFVQSRRTIDRSDGGLGLGLTLVKSLVEMHGGTVTAHSDGVGKGSEFVLRLPLGTERDVAAAGAAPRASAGLSRGARVVVVEDNADGREALCELLAHAGLHCETAGDGAAGLSLIERFHPHVAILDLGLPVLDGLELARRIRRTPELAKTYLIALTGYGQRVDRENALAAGFDEHLVKPVDTHELLRVLGLAESGRGRARETSALS
jgi:two-component system CheB/CheR fusion protein